MLHDRANLTPTDIRQRHSPDHEHETASGSKEYGRGIVAAKAEVVNLVRLRAKAGVALITPSVNQVRVSRLLPQKSIGIDRLAPERCHLHAWRLGTALTKTYCWQRVLNQTHRSPAVWV